MCCQNPALHGVHHKETRGYAHGLLQVCGASSETRHSGTFRQGLRIQMGQMCLFQSDILTVLQAVFATSLLFMSAENLD